MFGQELSKDEDICIRVHPVKQKTLEAFKTDNARAEMPIGSGEGAQD